MLRFAVLALTVAVFLPPKSQSGDAIPYPEGYRKWEHVKSEMLNPANPGFASRGAIHHIYANALAIDGYATGKFPDGAVIVADFLNAVDSGGVIRESSRNRIDVMVKGARFSATGGWGYERFRGDSRSERMGTPEQVRTCFGCHASRKDHDYVFSAVRP